MDAISERKISYIITAFENYALSDIKNDQKYKMPIAAFILCVCFMDQVSSFIYDKKKPGQRDSPSRSKKFVLEYLNKVSAKPYDQNDLIDLLRNKLVHNYSITDKKRPKHVYYALDYTNPMLHLHKQKERVFLNIEGFINDLEKAFNLYKTQLLSDEKFQRIAIENFDVYGILAHAEIPVDLADLT